MMKIDLTHKKALVGASTSGIGKAIALKLAECGASVYLVARNEAKLQSVTHMLDVSKGQEHKYVVADFNDFKNFKNSITEFLLKNPVDILVNNTQGPPSGTVLEKSHEDYQQAFELLFQNITSTSMAALPAMQHKKQGRIINVASISVKEPLAHLALSNTMRSAMVSWAKTLAGEVARDGVTVNTILTGYFDTERLNGLLKDQAMADGVSFSEIKKQKEAQVPAQRFGKPEEYAYLVAFLASDFAAYITGANIPIDGGLLRSGW